MIKNYIQNPSKQFKNPIFSIIISSCLAFFSPFQSFGQENEATEEISRLSLPYFMDDVKLIVGVNQAGLYWSDEFRNLSYGNGFQVGLEGFIPMGIISFLHYGIHYSSRSFQHLGQVDFNTNHLDFPIFASFSLPEFTSVNFRFLIGTQLSTRLSASQTGVYLSENVDQFQFDTNEFNTFDGGLFFGLSGEKKDFYLRVRSYVGISKLDRRDLGGMNAFYIDFGYFLLRKYR